MTITPYQIIVPIVSLVLILYAWNLVKAQKKTIWEGILWTVFWSAIAYAALFPAQLSFLSEVTGIQRNENAIIVTAIGVIFFVIFYLVIKIEELEQKLTRFVRSEALKDLDEKEKKDA